MYNREKVTEFLLSFIDFANTKSFLDMGCGKGSDLVEISKRVTVDSLMVGIDISERSIIIAKELTSSDDRFHFIAHNMETAFPFENDTFDVILSCNVIECIRDKNTLINELYRVLKPGGKVIIAHFDWDTQIFNAVDKDLFRHIIQTYNDWQQPWMNACDAWIGRRLYGIVNSTGLFSGTIFPFVLVETDYEDGYRGYSLVNDELVSLIENSMINSEDFNRFEKEIADLSAKGQYFYSINMYAYVGTKNK